MKTLKFLSKALLVGIMVFFAACERDEIKINKGPLFLEEIIATGTNPDTGEEVSTPLTPGTTKIPLDMVVTIVFSKAIDLSTASSIRLMHGTNPIEATVTADGASVLITPSSELEKGEKYTLAISTNLRASDGGLFYTGASVIFTTIGAQFDDLIAYWAFDGDYMEQVNTTNATKVGTPGFAGEGVRGGNSYAGATDAYLTFPTAALLGNEFSAAFWYKLNASPDRAGILIIGPPDPVLPATPNNRKNGFRFFREGSAINQTFKLNVGNGTADTWFDGGAVASINPTITTGWVHMAFTISDTECVVYFDGQVVKQGSFSGVDWTGCDILSIASGAPRFTQWGHLSDNSFMDELRLFNKALTQEEIQAIIDADM